MAGGGGGGGRCSGLLRGLVSLLFFLHIGHAGCCFSPPREEDDADGKGGGSKRRKISPLAFSPAASAAATVADERVRARRRHVSNLATSLRFYLHRVFSSGSSGAKAAVPAAEEEEAVTTAVSSPLARPLPQPQATPVLLSTPSSPCASPLSPQFLSVTPVLSSPLKQQPRPPPPASWSFAARGDVFPCKVCGEVLSKPQQLELHQSMKHSLSELSHLESSMNIIRMIFLAGWKPLAAGAGVAPNVQRVLRIHHNPRTLARFEEYRDLVRTRAVRRCASATAAAAAAAGGVEERCIADGNERLRFHCSTTLCSLGAGVCASPYCCACSILRHGFAGKQADVDGIATYASGRAAHASLPDDVEREFAFLQVRRAMLVCRVVAGRVGRGAADDKVAYDSVVPAGGGEDDAELLVFNPRAVLPCFVITYTAASHADAAHMP